MIVLPQSYLVMYDAPQSRFVLNALARSKLVMQFKGKIGCIPACPVDSEAGVNVISQEFAHKHGLSVDKSADVKVSMPDDESNCIVETCQVRGRIQAYQCLITFYVTHLADHF